MGNKTPDRRRARFTTVATYLHPVQAWIARNRLADEGIRAFVHDEFTVNVYWLYSNAIHGVKVQVPHTHTDAAHAVLSGLAPLNNDGDRAESAGTRPTEPREDHPTCEQCGSENIAEMAWAKRKIYLFWLLLGFPVPIPGENTVCFNCGHSDRQPFWKQILTGSRLRVRSVIFLALLIACVLGIFPLMGFFGISSADPYQATKPAGF